MSMNPAELEANLKTARERSDREQEARTLLLLGEHYQTVRRLPKAAALIAQALKISGVTENAKEAACVHARLGAVYWEMAQLKKAMTHFQQALENLKRAPHAEGTYRVQTLLAILYWRKCQWREGLAGFRAALKSRDNVQEETQDYLPLKQALERGVATLENRIRLAREQNDPLRLLQPLFSLAPLHLFTGNKTAMQALLQEAEPLAEQLGKQDILEVLPQLRALMEEMG